MISEKKQKNKLVVLAGKMRILKGKINLIVFAMEYVRHNSIWLFLRVGR